MKLFIKENRIIITIAYFLLLLFFWVFFGFITGLINKPLEGDEYDYIARGLSFAENGFLALSDAYRPPLLPIWIAFLSVFSGDENIHIMVRFFNILFLCALSSQYFIEALKNKIFLNYQLIMSFLLAVWIPFYYFSFYVYAEAISFSLIGLIVFFLTKNWEVDKTIEFRYIFILSVLLALLFLLKANNILISIPVALIIFFTCKKSVAHRFIKILSLTLLVIALISPWLYFTYQQSGVVKSTTTGGVNLLVGTGYYNFGMKPDEQALPDVYIQSKKQQIINSLGNNYLTPNQADKLFQIDPDNKIEHMPQSVQRTNMVKNLDEVAQNIAIGVWQQNTKEQVMRGLLKVMHSFGGSLRVLMDYFTLFTFFTSIVISFYLLKKFGNYNFYVYLHWGFTLVGAVLFFLFLPNIRFKTFYFDMSFLLILSITICNFILNFKKDKSKIETRIPRVV